MGPRVSLDAVAKKKIPSLHLQGIEPRRPSRNLFPILRELPRLAFVSTFMI